MTDRQRVKSWGPWDKSYIQQATDDWNEEIMFKAMTGDNEDEYEDEYEDDDWYTT